MRKLVFFIILILISFSLSAQNTFKYEIRANGGLRIGGISKIKIDSISYQNGRLRFYNGSTQLILDAPSGMIYPSGSGIPTINNGSWGTTIVNNSAYWNAAEPGLGNPDADGYMLTSTRSGVRTWITPPSGGSGMIYPSGSGIAVVNNGVWGTTITNNSTNWNTAYSERLRWDGDSTGLNASTARVSLALNNVTNESKATMFTNPQFTGTAVRWGTDTLATRAYARSSGGGGGLTATDVGNQIHDSIANGVQLGDVAVLIADTADMLAPYALLSEVGSGGVSEATVRQIVGDTIAERLAAAVPGVRLSDTLPGGTYYTQNQVDDMITSARSYTETQIRGWIGDSVGRLKIKTYNVLDYGADSTGVTESTSAIQAALNACGKNGVVYIPAGRYNVRTLVVRNNNTTIKGDGKYQTILRLVNNADAGNARGDLIWLNGRDNVTIKNIQLDGNMTNQTALDTPGTVTANSVGIYAYDSTAYTPTNNVKVLDCYIHHFAQTGIVWFIGDNCHVENCIVTHNGWGDIEYYGSNASLGQYTRNGFILNNTTGHSGNISIDVYNSSTTVQGNIILPMDGVNGTTDYPRGIQIEVASSWITPTNILIKDNIINGGGHTLMGIVAGPRTKNCSIQGNIISGLNYQSPTNDDSQGIWLKGDTASFVSDNHVIRYPTDPRLYHGITLEDCLGTTVSTNNIKNVTNRGIYLDNSDSCKVVNNVVECKTTYWGAIRLLSGSDNNVIKDNVLITHSANVVDVISDAGTNNKITNNYSTFLGTKLPDNVVDRLAVTATSDGTGTAIIKPGSQTILVTSSNSAHICRLPVANASTIGTIIRGSVGANGFELRVAASQSSTVYLNGVLTTGVGVIPANSSFEATQADATHWTLKCWGQYGQYINMIPTSSTLKAEPIFVFGLGSGHVSDTALFNNGRIAGAFRNNTNNTLQVTELRGVLVEGTGTETIAVQVSWSTNMLGTTRTNLNTSPLTITSTTTGTVDTTFDNNGIPAGAWVWCTLSGASANNKPSMLILQLTGYKR